MPLVDVDAFDTRAVIRSFEGHPENARWPRVEKPGDGDGVKMTPGTRDLHVGVWLDLNGGGILHCVRNLGVRFDDRFKVERVLGFNILGFHRFDGEGR